MGRSKNKRITKKIRYLTVRNTPQPHGRRVEFGRKTASRRFLPYFPLWQSMTYRLPGQPIIAQVHPVPRRHRRSTPTKLDVGPSPGQDSKRRKKKKKKTTGDRTIKTGHISSGWLIIQLSVYRLRNYKTTKSLLPKLLLYTPFHYNTQPPPQCLLSETPRNSLLALAPLPRALFLRCPSNYLLWALDDLTTRLYSSGFASLLSTKTTANYKDRLEGVYDMGTCILPAS